MTSPVNNNLYGVAIGSSSTNVFLTEFQRRAPTADDVNYLVQKRWVNVLDNTEYVLVNFSSTATHLVANWHQLSSGDSTVEKLQGNSGGPVGPNGSNVIFVQGDGSTTNVIGNPDTNTLTISTTLSNETVEVLVTTQLIGVDISYIANNVDLVTFTLPAMAVQGDFFRIIGKGDGGWKVDVGTNQVIQLGSISTTVSTGSISSTNQWDSIYVFCITSGSSTVWSVLGSFGNFNFT